MCESDKFVLATGSVGNKNSGITRSGGDFSKSIQCSERWDSSRRVVG